MLLNPSSCSHHTEAKQMEKLEFGAEKGLLPGQARRTEQFMLKSPQLPDDLGEEFLWAEFGGEVCGCVTFLWLVGGELTGWWSRNLHHQSPGSNQPGVHMLVLSLHWGGDLSSCSRTQMCIRVLCVTLGRARTLPHHCTVFLACLSFVPSLTTCRN